MTKRNRRADARPAPKLPASSAKPQAPPEPERPVQPGSGWAPFLALVAASLVFRLPALLNARGVQSDAAVVGLQAIHILKGEWSRFLWGLDYESSLDAFLVAAVFVLTGVSAMGLMLVPLFGSLLLSWFVFDMLRRRLGAWSSLVASLPLAFAPVVVVYMSIYVPRQWCLTILFAGIWFLDRGTGPNGRPWHLAAGALLGIGSLGVDLYALQFMVGFGAFALACALDGAPRGRVLLRRLVALALGGAVALLLSALVGVSPVTGSRVASFDPGRLPRNLRIFTEVCLPWLLGARVYIPGEHFLPDPWEAPPLFRVVQVGGAVLFLAGIVVGGALIAARRIPWSVRRLGGLGFVVSACTVGGFLISTRPSDMWTARYLAPLVLCAPFTLAPVVALLGTRRFAIGLAPYLLAVATSGWLGYGSYVQGPLPVRAPRGVAEEEAALGEFLRQRGIHYGAADYWLSYRLTFLFEEDPIILPFEPDRYQPYQQGFGQASRVAVIFHPSAPRASPGSFERQLRAQGQRYERVEVAGFTVFILERGL